MGTLNAFYIRIADETAKQRFLVKYPGAYTEPGAVFVAVERPRSNAELPEAELIRLSREFATDVIWLQFQSAVDAFHFRRWTSGEFKRALVYGCFEAERTWELVEGASEPWERTAIFDTNDLDYLLEETDGAAEQLRLRGMWTTGRLEVGSEVPMLESREVARQVAEHYRLPGWGLSEHGEGI